MKSHQFSLSSDRDFRNSYQTVLLHVFLKVYLDACLGFCFILKLIFCVDYGQYSALNMREMVESQPFSLFSKRDFWDSFTFN